jgi:hypothetical protein
MNKSLLLATTLLTLTLASGCRTTRPTAAKTDAAALSEAAYIRQVSRLSEPDYRTLTASLTLAINPDTKNEMSSNARLKIIRGERLQLSITPLPGIEMFRVEVSRDSMKIIDRLGKRYAAEPIAEIKKQIPAYAHFNFPYDFHYEHLEALLTNRLFMPNGGALALDSFHQQRLLLGAHRFRAKDTEKMTYNFTTDSHARLTSTELISPFLELNWQYTNFRTVSSRPFPIFMEAEVDGVKKLEIQFNKVETNEPVEINFPIPNHYKRITLQQLWRMINF